METTSTLFSVPNSLSAFASGGYDVMEVKSDAVKNNIAMEPRMLGP